MRYLLLTVLAILQCHAINSLISPTFINFDPKCNCKCDVPSINIDIPHLKRTDLTNLSVDKLMNKMHSNVDGNFKMITKILNSSKCNFPYVRRGLNNLLQSINYIIDTSRCSDKKSDKKLLDNGVERFSKAIQDMVADMRNASKTLSQECYDIFVKIKQPAFEAGENVIFAIQNSKC